MCKNEACCDFCDARCSAYVFEFTKTEEFDEELFIKEFLRWYDAGKPESNFEDVYEYKTVGRFFLSEWEPEDVIRGEDRRWSVWIDKVYKVGDRYFMTGYDHGLTEMQEDEYWDNDIQEVENKIEVKVIHTWKRKK